MPTIQVQPRRTPEERADTPVDIDVDDAISVNATTIEDWTAPRQNWEFSLREGHDFGRANNVEGHILFTGGAQTSTLTFRFDQLDAADDSGEELLLRFEEHDGIAKLARLTATGFEVELHHILTFT
jgi:hypothetical protein